MRGSTPSERPDRVALPSVAVVSSTALRISYTAPASDEEITSYNGRYRVDGTSTWTTVTGIASPWNITGLSATTTYQVQVRAISSAGTGLMVADRYGYDAQRQPAVAVPHRRHERGCQWSACGRRRAMRRCAAA